MLILSKAVFVMIPRTGTTWARQALRSAGVRYKEWGAKHSLSIKADAPGFRFTFVREPVSWLRSRWTLGPWEDELRPFWVPDPAEFSQRVTPAMVEMYFAKFTTLCSFIGHTETLADDLVRALTQAGERFSERELRATPRLNEAGPDYRLQREAFYELLPEQWCGLPPEDLLNLPTELLPQLPERGWERLDVQQTRSLARRLGGEAAPRRPSDLPIYVQSS